MGTVVDSGAMPADGARLRDIAHVGKQGQSCGSLLQQGVSRVAQLLLRAQAVTLRQLHALEANFRYRDVDGHL